MKQKLLILALSLVFNVTMGILPTLSGAEIIMASQDAMIVDGPHLAEENFGAFREITANWVHDYGYNNNAGLIYFDLSNILSTSIYNAKIGLFHKWNSSVEPSIFSLYKITSQWEESTVTWNTSPTFENNPVSTLTINDNLQGEWRYWDITILMNDWINKKYENYGVMLSRDDQENPYYYFSSKEDLGFAPKLLINESTNPVPEPSTALLLGIGLIGSALAGRRMRRA